MVGGQAADIMAERDELPRDEEVLGFIHAHKTAALIEAAMMVGGILAGAFDESVEKLRRAAHNIGVAFQMQDDILDVTGDFSEIGKPLGSDEKSNKLTVVALKGLEEAQSEVVQLNKEAISILSSFPRQNEFLLCLVESLMYREK
jgi:geranylgeranyl diphosphate synthase type II